MNGPLGATDEEADALKFGLEDDDDDALVRPPSFLLPPPSCAPRSHTHAARKHTLQTLSCVRLSDCSALVSLEGVRSVTAPAATACNAPLGLAWNSTTAIRQSTAPITYPVPRVHAPTPTPTHAAPSRRGRGSPNGLALTCMRCSCSIVSELLARRGERL